MLAYNPFVRYASRSRVYMKEPVFAYDCRLLFVLEGTGTFQSANHTFRLVPNTLLYYPAGICYHIQGTADLEFFTVNFDFDSAHAKETTTLAPVPPHLFDTKKTLNSHKAIDEDLFLTPFCLADAASFRNELEAVVQEQESRLILNDSVCSAYLKLVLCRILRLKNNAHADETAFMKTLSYIKEHYFEHLDNRVIAGAINYHPNYLNSVVRQKTGLSLHKYITAFRIGKATDLLCSGNLSVQEISEKCGFVNANHFSACFKKETGTSPLNFRKGAR